MPPTSRHARSCARIYAASVASSSLNSSCPRRRTLCGRADTADRRKPVRVFQRGRTRGSGRASTHGQGRHDADEREQRAAGIFHGAVTGLDRRSVDGLRTSTGSRRRCVVAATSPVPTRDQTRHRPAPVTPPHRAARSPSATGSRCRRSRRPGSPGRRARWRARGTTGSAFPAMRTGCLGESHEWRDDIRKGRRHHQQEHHSFERVEHPAGGGHGDDDEVICSAARFRGDAAAFVSSGAMNPATADS